MYGNINYWEQKTTEETVAIFKFLFKYGAQKRCKTK